MIYKDREAIGDSENYPMTRMIFMRPANCLNCFQDKYDHVGWRCANSNSRETTFSRLRAGERYLTQSMKDSITHNTCSSINPLAFDADTIHAHLMKIDNFPSKTPINTPVKPSPIVDISDWRAWAHNRPGECACGIKREQCTYHK